MWHSSFNSFRLKKIQYTILLLTCLLRLTTSFAQTSITVLDKTTQLPIFSATVEEIWTDNQSGKLNLYKGKTNAAGQYELHEDGIKYQGYLIISHTQYQILKISTFDLLKKGVIISLSLSAIEISEVIISANKFEEQKKDIPRQIEVIHKKEISFSNQQTTANLLQNTGQVFVQKSQMGGGSPIMRGFEANKILIVVDGIRMNNAIYRSGHLQNVLRIDQNMLEQTELFFGPGSVVYGSDALGGVLHFSTLKPIIANTEKTIFKHHFFTRYGTVNDEITSHYDINIGLKKWAFVTSFSTSSFSDLKQGANRKKDMGTLGIRDSLQTRINGKDVAIVNENALLQSKTGYKQVDLLQKILFAPNTSINHLINIQYSNTTEIPRYDRLTEKTNGVFNSAEWYYGPETRVLAAYQLNLKKKNTLYDEAKFIAAYQYIEESRHNRNFGNNNKTHRNEYVHVASANIDLAKRINHNELRYGIELTYNDVISNAHSENIVTGIITPQSTRYPDGGSNMKTAAAYLSHSWEISEKFILTDGLRYNYVKLESTFINKTFYSFLPNQLSQQNSAVNGQLGLVYLPEKNWKLSTAFATGFRAPNVDDVGKIFDSQSGKLAIIPNPKLNPEYSYTLEAGIEKVFYQKIKLGITGYYTWVTNLISNQRVQVNGSDSIVYNGLNTLVIQSKNSENAFIYGTSISLSADISNNISLVNTFNYTYGRIKTENTQYPLDHIPPVFGRSAVNIFLKNIRSEFFVLYNGWKQLADYNLLGEDNLQYATVKGMPSWYTLNFRLAYTYVFKQKHIIQCQLGCENILDQNYRNFASGISAPGRNIYITVGFTL
jgi:hemoglobin/transferrin/lactoferrin receptor protein